MTDNLKTLIEKYSRSYDNITAYVNSDVSKTVQLNGMETESVDFSNDSGISLRVLKDGRTAAISYDGIDTARAEDFLLKCQNVIRELPADENNVMPTLQKTSGDIDSYDAECEKLDISALTETAKIVTDAAMMADKRIKAVKQSIVTSTLSRTTILQPFAEPLMAADTSFSAMAYVIADDGGERDAYGSRESVYFSDLNPAQAGKEASISACELLRAKRLKTGRYGILFTADVMSEFADLIAELVNGENLYKNISMFCGKIGQRTASENLTITDEPLTKRGIGSCLFDDEGQTAANINILDKGVFTACLNSAYTAKALGVSHTANARLSSGGHIVPGYSNLKIMPTTDKMPYDFMTEYVKVTEVMGMHTADTISGDFSVGVSGVLYRNGEQVHPFREAVLSGNLKYMLEGALAVFSNVKTIGSVTCADTLFDKMTLSGE